MQNAILSSSVGGELCIDVIFAEGHKSQSSAVKLVCLRELRCCYTKTVVINQTSQCLSNLPSSNSCNISVTDYDARDSINASPAIKITGVTIAATQTPSPPSHLTTTSRAVILSSTKTVTIATPSPTTASTG